MSELIRKRETSTALVIIYIIVSYILVVVETSNSDSTSHIIVMLLLHIITTSISLTISMYINFFLFKFIVDTRMNVYEFINVMMLTNTIAFLTVHIVSLKNDDIQIMISTIFSAILLSSYYIAILKKAKSKCAVFSLCFIIINSIYTIIETA